MTGTSQIRDGSHVFFNQRNCKQSFLAIIRVNVYLKAKDFFNIKDLIVNVIRNALKFIGIAVIVGFSLTSCEDATNIAYKDPMTITVTGIDESDTAQPLAFVGIFVDSEQVMMGQQGALAGGYGLIVDGKAVIDLWYPIDQSPFTDIGNYHVALMFGESQDNPIDTYFFVGNDAAGTAARKVFEEDFPNMVEMVTSGDPPPSNEIILASLETLGGLDGVFEIMGNPFILFNNLKDNTTINLDDECADITVLLNFAKRLGLAQY